MSDYYKDTTRYVVYFVLGAVFGASFPFLVKLRIRSIPTLWEVALGALVCGILAVIFGDRFWDWVKQFLS